MSKAIIGVVKKHAGEIVEFDKRRTTWRLAQVERRSKGLAELCWCETQFHWLESGRPLGDVYAAHLAEPVLSEEVDQLIWYDAANVADEHRCDVWDLYPDWKKQYVRVAAPIISPDYVSRRWEWRRHCGVTTLGQLLLHFGHRYTAKQIYGFYRCLEVVAVKRWK